VRGRELVRSTSARHCFSVVLILAWGLFLAAYAAWGGGTKEAPVDRGANESLQAAKLPFPKPDSHRAGWLGYHGTVAPLSWNEAGQAGNSCMICHERGDCINCHNTQPPRNHTAAWRTRTHGFAAGAARERCLVCHRQDTCVRCHNETPPRTHTQGWLSDHCSWCHFGPGKSVADNCVVCHKNAFH
jgi:hypothetical protein